MSSTSPAASNHDGSGSARRRKLKQSSMSVAERLKMTKSKGPYRVQTDLDEDNDDEDGEKQYAEDGIDQKLDKGGSAHLPKLELYDQSTLRIVAQYLDGLGLKESVDKLVEESGCTVENSQAAKIKNAIIKGNYDVAIQTIDKCCPKYLSEQETNDVKFQLECFKIICFVKSKRLIDAIFSLREMSAKIDEDDTHKMDMLSALLKETLSIKDVDSVEFVDMRKSQIDTVQGTLSTNFMLPANRLRDVLKLAHGPADSAKAQLLLKDEEKPVKNNKNYKCAQILSAHDSEVWIVKFSSDGKLMASGSKSNKIVLWKSADGKLTRIGRMAYVADGDISCLEWSHGNKFLAVCGTSQCRYNLTVFDTTMRNVYRTIRVQPSIDDFSGSINAMSYFTCCGFFQSKSSQKLIAGNEHGIMRVYDMASHEDTQVLKTISGFRVRCVYGFRDERRILACDSHNRIRIYHVDSDSEYTLFSEEVPIVTFTVHSNEQLVLTTTTLNLRLWDLRTRTLIRYFSGACQQDDFSRYVIHASFGGAHQGFIATGTIGDPVSVTNLNPENDVRKDPRVCVWSLDDCRPILKIKGHKGHVNAVTWNPRDPTMVVSCSDDGTIRVWSLDRELTEKSTTILPKRSQKSALDDSINSSKNGKMKILECIAQKVPPLHQWTQEVPTTSNYTYFKPQYDLETQWIDRAKKMLQR